MVDGVELIGSYFEKEKKKDPWTWHWKTLVETVYELF